MQQRQLLAVRKEDIFIAFIYQIGVLMEDIQKDERSPPGKIGVTVSRSCYWSTGLSKNVGASLRESSALPQAAQAGHASAWLNCHFFMYNPVYYWPGLHGSCSSALLQPMEISKETVTKPK